MASKYFGTVVTDVGFYCSSDDSWKGISSESVVSCPQDQTIVGFSYLSGLFSTDFRVICDFSTPANQLTARPSAITTAKPSSTPISKPRAKPLTKPTMYPTATLTPSSKSSARPSSTQLNKTNKPQSNRTTKPSTMQSDNGNIQPPEPIILRASYSSSRGIIIAIGATVGTVSGLIVLWVMSRFGLLNCS